MLNGKTAVITGAAGGIGKAVAERYAAAGAKVLLSDLSETRGMLISDEMNKKGFQTEFFAADVSRSGDVQALMRAALGRFGDIDILITCAGVLCDDALAQDVPDDVWFHLLDTNLTGVFLCCKYALAHMVGKQKGSIINFASVSGLIASKFNTPYVATKSGVIGLTRSIANDYAQFGIRANAICPGATNTRMITDYLNTLEGQTREDTLYRLTNQMPIKRLGEPEDMAGMALLLASDESSYITGASIPIDGGYTAI